MSWQYCEVMVPTFLLIDDMFMDDCMKFKKYLEFCFVLLLLFRPYGTVISAHNALYTSSQQTRTY